MPVTLIVTAHPGQGSFTRAWAQASRDACAALGHTVLESDLYAMGFDPAERGAHYGAAPGPFDPLKAQEGALPPQIAAEVEKIRAADLVILHFPLWWFAPPAMLKGWCDRVLAHGHLHDVGRRFDTGLCRGKTALFCVSTGASAAELGPGGKEGHLDLLLWPLAYTLRYCGFDVAHPVAAHGVHGYWQGADRGALEHRLGGVLRDQAGIVQTIDDRPRWPFNADGDFDAEGRLTPDAPRHWPFIA